MYKPHDEEEEKGEGEGEVEVKVEVEVGESFRNHSGKLSQAEK